MLTKKLHTFVLQILISCFLLALGSSCGGGTESNQPTTQHNQPQTKFQNLLDACKQKNQKEIVGLILLQGSLKNFDADEVTKILFAAHTNGLAGIYPSLMKAFYRDCPTLMQQLSRERQEAIKETEKRKRQEEEKKKSSYI